MWAGMGVGSGVLESYLEQRGKSVPRVKIKYSEKETWRCGTGQKSYRGGKLEPRVLGVARSQEVRAEGLGGWGEDAVKGSRQAVSNTMLGHGAFLVGLHLTPWCRGAECHYAAKGKGITLAPECSSR